MTASPGAQWPQLVFQLQADETDSLERALFASGALSVIYQDQYDQPILEPEPGEFRLWRDVRLIALFALESQPDSILASLAEQLDGKLPAYEWLPLPDQQWERAWMSDFKPMQFAEKLWIVPTHCEPEDPAAVNVRLDPGLAFGTGTHATTRQCLEWLGNASMAGRDVLDFGCGSGVLAIAAALLGAQHVTAVDIDAQAISSTQDNAAINQVADRLTTGEPERVQGLEFDVVLANILYQPLMDLAPVFAAALRPSGSLVMSGILLEQIESIQLRYTQWFRMESSSQQGSWALIHATRRA